MGSGNHENGDDKSGAPGITTLPAQGATTTTTTAVARADIDIRAVDEFGQTELHRAAKAGDTARVLLLIDEYGAEVDVRDGKGWTALFISCLHNDTNTALALLERNANPNISDSTLHCTPLMLASGNLSEILVLALLAKGAECDAFQNDHRTAMHFAATAQADDNAKLYIIKLLLQQRAAVTIDDYGWTPRDYLNEDLSYKTAFDSLVGQHTPVIGEI